MTNYNRTPDVPARITILSYNLLEARSGTFRRISIHAVIRDARIVGLHEDDIVGLSIRENGENAIIPLQTLTKGEMGRIVSRIRSEHHDIQRATEEENRRAQAAGEREAEKLAAFYSDLLTLFDMHERYTEIAEYKSASAIRGAIRGLAGDDIMEAYLAEGGVYRGEIGERHGGATQSGGVNLGLAKREWERSADARVNVK